MTGHLGEIKIVAFNFIPINYVLCDGRRLKKTSNHQLHLIVGDKYTYDNSDDTTFAIPDLRNRFVLQPETSNGLGVKKGADEIVLSMEQMPEHNHNVSLEVDNISGSSEPVISPKDAFLNNQAGVFSTEPSTDTFLAGISQNNVGNSQPIQIKNAHVKMVYAMCIQNDPNEGTIGEIKIWPNAKTDGSLGAIPNGWRLCNGDLLASSQNSALYSIIGYHYGGSIARNEFKLPDFRNRFATGITRSEKVGATGGKTNIRLDKNNLPPHNHSVKLGVNNNTDSTPHTQLPNNAFINSNAGTFSEEISSLATLGGISQEDKGSYEDIDVTNPSLGLNYIICTQGIFPSAGSNGGGEGVLGEIILFAGFRARFSNYILCSGQKISISSNQALFSLLGTSYGGNGSSNFDLPDLRNKIPLCVSKLVEVGKSGGANTIKLTSENLPAHNHNVQLAANHGADGRRVNISDSILNKDAGMFSTKETENTYLAGIKEHEFVGQEIDIRNPFLGINYLICINGTFPIRPTH
ncbi:phage tail protein [Arcticibacterium luteifluviistationis]|uniref:Phage tail collar domain-containing protein n=1 Tax=Arcticibacterium luteifluviistationis TaxID=1784714 RepID=A0A2Z4GCE0_9BACT|nr:tail fiber protein [Arcticibacterium luteifluviistationis]AWV98728.1 hypothetical protein DJ013_11310 [Arcticibacterium luteifluviistationis]